MSQNKIHLYDYAFKIVLVGDQSVGKTSLLERIVHNKYTIHDVPTIGVEFQAKILTLLNGKKIKCQVWDTAGQEAFAPIIKTYFRGSAGVMVCYDVKDRNALKNVKKWIDAVSPSVPMCSSWIIVGTKSDQRPNCDLGEIEKYATDNSMNSITCSARNNFQCKNILNILCENIYKNIDHDSFVKQTGITKMQLTSNKNSYRDCDQVEITDCGTGGRCNII